MLFPCQCGLFLLRYWLITGFTYYKDYLSFPSRFQPVYSVVLRCLLTGFILFSLS
ncbi:hypothetical protein mgb1_022 [Bacillus phage MG-B1]|uniref:Uncharacterized protein n=1 Tax=Bacillus phage MG-B1 TaxID=1309583 RepID=M4WNI9_9CAUD|nr:hypothetical protein mgb1_022 [Bacillus phage MG-B1]AGI10611.1 hypothetical protein mgb1_022 [Bacillus phage MG-B1]